MSGDTEVEINSLSQPRICTIMWDTLCMETNSLYVRERERERTVSAVSILFLTLI